MRMMRLLALSPGLIFAGSLSLRAAEIPRPAPEFALHMSDGSQQLLSQYKGKVVLLLFIYTTCPHCQHTTQLLSGMQTEFASRGLQVLAAAFNPQSEQLVANFITQFHPTFPVGSSNRESVMDYLQQAPNQPGYVPEVVFIDRKRVIRAQYSGDDPFFKDQEKNFRDKIEAMVNEPVPAAPTARSTSHKKKHS